MGVYISDLCMHDASRDMVMVGTNQSKTLKSALNQVSGTVYKTVHTHHTLTQHPFHNTHTLIALLCSQFS